MTGGQAEDARPGAAASAAFQRLAEQHLDAAYRLARVILRQPEMNRRYARVLLTEQLRRRMNELLPLGLALEGLAITQ